ncbi:MAG: DegQ family serine endoprotease [Candidatus Tectomicrobia bacterium]|uniref:Probable periplasmic serine endoprotease DegP-like n=1 Tax=Tectimicrobiota bacterium TaxID=2528274 RepID=A0A933GLZ8_UNCTE|nr:DegQ family serine endoprotease [Candidatus Tectomicrobia bacterium]
MALLLKVQAAYDDSEKDQVIKVAAEQSPGQKTPSEQNGHGLPDGQWSPPRSFASLAKKLKPAVVNISTSKIIKDHPPIDEKTPKKEGREWKKSDPFWEQFDKFFGSQPRKFKSRSLGSGFIIAQEGYIITNNHVVEETDEITVQLADQKELKASIIGRDMKTDLALIKVETKESLPTVKLGDSEKLEVGDWVLAIGNPFGFEHSVTAGIVSAKGRLLGGSPYEDFIQTDASINPGNSGGPLFNMQGEVVGINSAVITSAQGLGFAISINNAKDLIPQLREKGKIVRAWLGINIQEVTEDIAGSFGLDKAKGVLISNVIKGTPADKFGLKRGDIILEFNGQGISEIRALQKQVAASPVGVEQTLKLLREGQEMFIPIKLEEMRDKVKDQPSREGKWGIMAREITPEIAKGLGIKEEKGVIVTEVKENSLADKAGVRRGDIILEINRKGVKTLEEFQQRVDELKEGDYYLLLVKRGESINYLAFKIAQAEKQ